MSSKRIAVLGSVIHPLTPGNLALWIDFADASTVTTDTGGISQVDDKSGNGYHLTQGTSGSRPDYSGSLNGRNIATFAGGPDYIHRSTPTDIGRNVPGITSYLVWKHTSSPTARQNLFGVQGGGGVVRHYLYAGNSSNKFTGQGRRLDGDAYTTLNGSANIGTSWHIGTCMMDFIAGTITIYIDGASDGSTALASSGGNSSNTASPNVIISSANASFDLVGNVAELLVYNAAHDADTRARVWAYLRNKWGL